MSTLSDIREGIETVLEANISKLRVYPYEPDSPLEYPCVVVEATGDIDYDLDLGGNSYRTDMFLTLYVQIGSSEEGWKEIDKYRSSTGTESIKAAIEVDRSLNSKADDSHITFSTQVVRDQQGDDKIFVFSTRFTLDVVKSVA